MGKGLEKMLGNYIDPKKRWRDANKDYISTYNQQYFQQNRDRVYAKRQETRNSQSGSFF
jgi:hypothetical protein